MIECTQCLAIEHPSHIISQTNHSEQGSVKFLQSILDNASRSNIPNTSYENQSFKPETQLNIDMRRTKGFYHRTFLTRHMTNPSFKPEFRRNNVIEYRQCFPIEHSSHII